VKLTTQVQLLKRLRRRGAIPLLPQTSFCYGEGQLYLLTYIIPAARGGAVFDEYIMYQTQYIMYQTQYILYQTQYMYQTQYISNTIYNYQTQYIMYQTIYTV